MKKILFILLLFVQVYSDNNITIIQKLSFECDIGQSNSCVELAEIYFKDVNKNINYKKAAYFYEKACDYNNKYGCYNLGVMYRYGCNSVDRLADYEKALLFYTKACKLGKKNNSSCKTMQNLRQIIQKDDFDKDAEIKVDCKTLPHILGM